MGRRGKRRYRAVAVGVSTGGVDALKTLLGGLPADYPLPILVVAHLSPDAGDGLAQLLDDLCPIRVKEADDFESIAPATVYLAPPNYHMQLEHDGRITLTVDPPVNYARPSVDVLFETAADALRGALVAVVLTGAGYDGSRGVAAVARQGGVTVVQNPESAVADSMPKSAIASVAPDYLLPLEQVSALLVKLAGQ